MTEEIEGMRFNTAIAAMMEFTNAAYKVGSIAPAPLTSYSLVILEST